MQAHGQRVRGIVQASQAAPASAWDAPLASGSSDGVVRLWDLRRASSVADASSLPLHEVETHARITCMACIRMPGAAGGDGVGPAAVRLWQSSDV